jgi:Recombination endonuclease VII/NUMOD3 motif
MKKGFKFENGFSEEHRKKIGDALRGRQRSAEHCAAISRAKSGKSVDLSARRSYAGEANPFFGKGHDEQALAKIGEATLGRRWKRFEKYGITKEQYESNISAGLRWCSYHKNFVAPSEFSKGQTICIVGAREKWLSRNYGVSLDWYDKRLAEQNGVCAVCGAPPFGKKKFLDVDHCHTTMRTRGLLCPRCNMAVERIDTVPDWIGRVQSYLKDKCFA